MSHKPRSRTPTPEAMEAARAREAEEARQRREWWLPFERRAVRILLGYGAPLFGVDVANPSMLAERQQEVAHKDRFALVSCICAFHPSVTDAELAALVRGDGPHGSDRFAAVWWAGISPSRVLWPDCPNPVARLMAPVEELVAARIVRPEALDVLRGRAEDPNAAERDRARRRTAEFLKDLHRLASEPQPGDAP